MGKKFKNRDGSMSLVEHLQELRSRLVKALLLIFMFSLVGFFWYSHPVNMGNLHLLPLGEFLKKPYCSIPAKYRANFTDYGSCKLLATGIQDQLLLRLKISTLFGIIFSAPFWLYQLWKFIVPGLKKNEKKYTLLFVLSSSSLFIAGIVLAFLITPKALKFLLSIGQEVQVTALTGDAYFGFVTAFMLIFGISFEIPLLITMLNFAGVIRYSTFKKSRRMIFFLAFLFAGIATPGQDPYSMIILAVVLIFLLEISIQVTRLHDKKLRTTFLGDEK